MDEKYNFPLFEGASDEKLAWLIATSHEETLEQGDVFARESEPTRYYIVLEGELQVRRMMNGQERVMGATPRGVMGGHLLTETMQLCALGLTQEQLARLTDCKSETYQNVQNSPILSLLDRSDREDEIASWLDEIGVENSWDIAPTFVSAGMTVNKLAAIAAELPPAFRR